MSQEHQHLTTEQLSAFIDKQLSAEEQGQVDEHLTLCAQCQFRLENLRQTVRLIHALPQPQLSRSFALPIDALVTPFPSQTKHTNVVATHHSRPSYIRTTIRVISSLAAIVGIAFLLSGLVSLSHGSSSSGSTVASSASSAKKSTTVSNQAQQASQAVTPHIIATSVNQATPQIVTPSASNVEPAAPPDHQPDRPSTTPPSPPLFSLGQPAERVVFGIVLLVLSCVGFIAVRLRRS